MRKIDIIINKYLIIIPKSINRTKNENGRPEIFLWKIKRHMPFRFIKLSKTILNKLWSLVAGTQLIGSSVNNPNIDQHFFHQVTTEKCLSSNLSSKIICTSQLPINYNHIIAYVRNYFRPRWLLVITLITLLNSF